ncbi:MAG: hypothetical protein ACXWZ2_04220, partial [Mycobacterium sp.]
MTDQPPPPPGNYPPPPPSSGGTPPPPPQGGYPPPQGGGYPSAQPPGAAPGGYPPPQYAGYPPPGAPGGYPPAGPGFPGAQAFNVGEAFSWAWNKFTKNAVALMVPALVYGIIIGILAGAIYGLAFALAPTTTYESYGNSYSYEASFGLASILVLIVGYLILMVVAAAIQSAYLGGVLDIANGQPVAIGSFFKPRNVGSVIIATLIIGIAAGIGSFCFIVGLVISVFTLFTTVIIVDRNASPIDAIKQSVEITKNNIGPVILTWLVAGVIVAVGALVCGIGLIVAIPVAALFL